MSRTGPEISAETIDACRRGDRAAFRALYDAYKDRVYSIALYFFHGDEAAAADASQQVWVKLLTNAAAFRGESGFATWLYRLVVNTCLDNARKNRSQAAKAERAARQPPPRAPSHERGVADARLAASIQEAVASLPPRFRVAVLLRYFDDLSYEEMAAALNCSMGTVASRLSRGHRMLAAKLAPFRDWFTRKG